MGVPQEWLQTVKALETEEQLNELAEWLPAGAWENVYFLFEGFSVDEVMQQMIVKEQRGLYETQRHFLIAENEYELRSMLDAPLEKWRVFLHPMQRALVEHHWKGPVKVLGGAGTGKTVVAMHRAKFLVEQVFTQEHERILLTTYTKSLAADIQGQLQQICRPETLHRIEVVNIDRWLLQFLSSEGVARDVLFQPAEHHLWRTALEFHDRTMPFTELFYRDEWELVVQEHDVFTLEQYLQVDRVGRGTRLDRAQRERLWPVFAEYRKFLEQARKWEQPDAIRQALRQLALRAAPLYRAVIVDEVQDMSNHVLKLLRALAGPQKDNDLFLVGDVHQRIYRRFPRLSNGGIDVLGRSRKLYINYRTTDEIRKWAIEMLAAFTADDLEGGSDPLRGYRSLTFGMKPDILRFADADQELEHVVDRLRGLNREQLNQTCIVARSNELLDRYAEALESARVDVLRLSNQQNDDRTAPGVRLATMHRVKGLEFETVIMVAVNEGLLPKSDSPEMSHENDRDRADFLQRERALLYVAATRAKRHLIVCGYGKPSPFLE
jgi:superfamily I DNA/RNA helicase